eukprot:TRINITY_DN1508_c0_g1_i2.p1 TRINITY_DN1508_c0_g1~~TRINITY_DN1508_c0_g1_i2.p1  ORF type:complete len:554 (-),score=159.24 TRINITY_DN1508_c0_g1_i2:147-1808(-)
MEKEGGKTKEAQSETINVQFSQILSHFDGDLDAACSALCDFYAAENGAIPPRICHQHEESPVMDPDPLVLTDEEMTSVSEVLESPFAFKRLSLAADMEKEGELEYIRLASRRLLHSYQRRVDELRLLNQVIEEVNRGLTLDEVLNHVWVSFRRVIPFNRIGFSLLNPAGFLEAKWARTEGKYVQISLGYKLHITQTTLMKIIEAKEPRVIPDLEEYYRSHPSSVTTPMILREGGLSSLTCPLITNGKVAGFIFFTSFEKNSYKRSHVMMMRQLSGSLSAVVEKSSLYQQLLFEQERSDEVLRRTFPAAVAEQLLSGDKVIAERHDCATILFADIVGFTEFSSDKDVALVVSTLNELLWVFEAVSATFNVEKIKTLGDGIILVAGVPVPIPFHAKTMIECALKILIMIEENRDEVLRGLDIRIGINSGPILSGIIGSTRFAFDIWGDAVNVASRMETTGVPGMIHISPFTYELVKDVEGFVFSSRVVSVKGKGEMTTYIVKGTEEKLKELRETSLTVSSDTGSYRRGRTMSTNEFMKELRDRRLSVLSAVGPPV